MQYEIEVNGRLRQVTINRVDGRLAVLLDGKECAVDVACIDGYTMSLLVRGSAGVSRTAGGETPFASYEVTIAPNPQGSLTVQVRDTPLAVSLNGRRAGRRRDGAAPGGSAQGPQRIVAPMPGKIVRVLVKAGEAVRARQPVVVIEAMKMENELRAAGDGTLAELHVQDGESVDAGALLAVIHR